MQKQKRHSIKPITPRYLENVATFYLQRFSASKESLRRVLLRRIRKAAALDEESVPKWRAMADDLIARYEAQGILNDQSFAQNKSRLLRDRGASARVIRQKLLQKGLAPKDIDQALRSSNQDMDEKRAALRLAQRRRIGPYRGTKPKDLNRELATLARGGFSLAVARFVLQFDSVDQIELE